MRATIEVETVIAAPAHRVWSVLTDFDAYPDWNPYIRSVRGELRDGGRLVVRLQPPGHRALVLRSSVRTLRPRRELRWLGRLVVPWLLDGEDAFLLDPVVGDRTRFVHRERLRGLLVPFLGRRIRAAERGCEEMSAALKRRAEARREVVEVPPRRASTEG